MEIINELYNYFGIDMLSEAVTFPELLIYLVKVGFGIFVVCFFISSFFRLIGYINRQC